MKNLFKQSYWIVIAILVCGPSLFSQVSVMQYRNVSQENIDEFIHRETTYWSQVAQKAVDEGKLLRWSLWQRVGGWDMDENSANFVFVNTVADAKGLDNMGEIWNPMASFPDGRIADMETGSLSKVVHQIYARDVATVTTGEPFQYAVVNYAKASDVAKYLELETTTWMPFIKPLIEGGTVAQKYWGVSRVISPSGTGVPFNAVTVDGFDTLSDALSPTFPENIETPSFVEFNEVHDKAYIQVYRLVKAVQ